MRVVELAEPAALREAAVLLAAAWHSDEPPVHPDLMRALAHTGHHLAGAYLDSRLVGATVGVLTGDGGLHSHVTGVAPDARGRGVGGALKRQQRDWALARGITRVCWTYDPLVRRNAHLNLVRLGARPTAYLVDFYGPMGDALNGDDPSDRLDVTWRLDGPEAVAALAGRPAGPATDGAAEILGIGADGGPVPAGPAGAERVLVAVPADIEGLRRDAPAVASAWRSAVRAALVPALDDGYRITGLTGSGRYVLERR